MQALLVCDMPEAGTTSPGHTCCHAHCCQAHCPALTLQSQGIAGFNRNYPENRENTARSAACTFTPSELAVAPVGSTIPCYESTTLALLAGAGWTEKPSDEHKVQKREGFVPNSSLLVLPVSLQDRFWASVSSNLASPQGQSQSRGRNKTHALRASALLRSQALHEMQCSGGRSPALSSRTRRQSRTAELFAGRLEPRYYLLRHGNTRISKEGRQTMGLSEGINSDLLI